MTAPEPPKVVAVQPSTLPAKFLAGIPRWSASRAHIWLMVALWVLLVPVTLIWPHLIPLAWQIALGNHTNVISATGASIAAGAGIATHHEVKRRRAVEEERHTLTQEAHAMVAALHQHHLGQSADSEGTPS